MWCQCVVIILLYKINPGNGRLWKLGVAELSLSSTAELIDVFETSGKTCTY